MSSINELHNGDFRLDHIKVPYTVRQTTDQELDIQVGDGFCRVMILLRNDGNFEVVLRDYEQMQTPVVVDGEALDTGTTSVFLGNIRKDW